MRDRSGGGKSPDVTIAGIARISNPETVFPAAPASNDRFIKMKKRHKQYAVPRLPSPSRAPGFSGARPFAMMRKPAPQIQPGADGCATVRVRRHATAAGRGDPLVYGFPVPCLCLGQDRNPVPGIQYITFRARFNAGKRPACRFFSADYAFSPTWSSLLYRFRRRRLSAGDGLRIGSPGKRRCFSPIPGSGGIPPCPRRQSAANGHRFIITVFFSGKNLTSVQKLL